MLILASQSPRRIELMERLKLPFKVVISHVDEMIDRPTDIKEIPSVLATRKATAIFNQHPQDIVIGADTIVVIDNQVLEKASTPLEAREMLIKLSGKTHTVYTGVCILSPMGKTIFTSQTDVSFYDLDENEINRYLSTQEWQDKAGAYAIQGFGSLMIEKIRGDFFTVVGFPIAQIHRALIPHLPTPQ